jgi:hypothetical protein
MALLIRVSDTQWSFLLTTSSGISVVGSAPG